MQPHGVYNLQVDSYATGMKSQRVGLLQGRTGIGTDRPTETPQRRKDNAKRYCTVAELFMVCSHRAFAYNRVDSKETSRDALRIIAFVKGLYYEHPP